MIYRTYGRTDKRVSVLGFGGMRFADVEDTALCVEMMLEAASGGVNYFDTAPKYFDTRSEAVFGEGFREMRRKGLPFYCATKTFETNYDSIRRNLEQQLRRLQVDVIDFYHIWAVKDLDNWKERLHDGVLEAFRRLKEEGLIGHICVSSHLTGWQIESVLAEDSIEGVLCGYSAYNFQLRQPTIDLVSEKGLGCAVMNPLGGGLIPRNPDRFEFLKTRADETVTAAAIRFLIAHRQIDLFLVGFAEIEEVRQALKAVEGYQEIRGEVLAAIKRRASGMLEGICTGCRYCDSCPVLIPVPQFMDAYNQRVLGNGNEAIIERLSAHWGISRAQAELCTECGQCEGSCTQHLGIVRRLREISALEEPGNAQPRRRAGATGRKGRVSNGD